MKPGQINVSVLKIAINFAKTVVGLNENIKNSERHISVFVTTCFLLMSF
jgi:hypothetical protein